MSATLVKIGIALLLAYVVYRRAKRSGMWDWMMFFQVVGAIVAFGVVFVGGMVYTNLPKSHPGLFFALFFVGLAGFAAGLVVLSKRMTKELKRRREVLHGS